MDFTKPSETGYTIYTKEGCSYCIKAKILLSNHTETSNIKLIECDDYLTISRNDFLEFIKDQCGIEYKTFPIIFYNGKLIGGFTELTKYIDKVNAFCTDMIF